MHDIIHKIFLFHCIGMLAFLPVVTFKAGRQRERGDGWTVILVDGVVAVTYWPAFLVAAVWDLVIAWRKR